MHLKRNRAICDEHMMWKYSNKNVHMTLKIYNYKIMIDEQQRRVFSSWKLRWRSKGRLVDGKSVDWRRLTGVRAAMRQRKSLCRLHLSRHPADLASPQPSRGDAPHCTYKNVHIHYNNRPKSNKPYQKLRGTSCIYWPGCMRNQFIYSTFKTESQLRNGDRYSRNRI